MKYALVLLLLTLNLGFAQEEWNKFDENGKRHGPWKKLYEGTKLIKLTGTFEHGKPVGEFKYYHKKSGKQPSTVKIYDKNSDMATVKHYTSKGKLISEGQMKGKELFGKWTYYHKKTDAVLSVEYYKDGELDGERVTYYENGNLVEQEFYKRGILHGDRKVFSEKGNVIKHFQYINGTLEGKVYYYDDDGNVTIEGKYKNGKRISVWKYYKNGKQYDEKDYTISRNPYKKKN